MKGSKNFGKSILSVVLSLVLIVSAAAPLTVMGSDNNGGGIKGTSLGQYRYYSVKAGDTLESIASSNGVTVSDIMTFNNLDSNDKIYRGQILKLPVTTANQTKSIVSSSITIKTKDASVKDVVSAIAYNAGYTVIYKGSDQTVSIELEKVSPLKAIDYVTRYVGLSYIKDGNTILVSTPDDLNSTFVDSLVLTKFTFKYITYDELLAQASALGLSSIKTVSQSNNNRSVWISAYPKEMAKLKELIDILDAPENISVGSNSIAKAFTPIELKYITASEFSSLLGSLGLHTGITMSSYPMTLFVYVSGTALTDILTIKKVVDTKAAIQDDLNGGNSVNPDAGNNGGSNADSNNNNNDSNTNTGNNTGDTNNTPDETPVAEPTTFEKIDLVNISRSDAEALIGKSGEQISTYGHARMTKSLWLFGTASAIEKVKDLISAVDGNVASASSTVHTYTAQNCTVDELMARLSNVQYENVSFYQYNHSSITNNIIVYCDDVTWNNEIHDLLVTLDTVDTGAKTWIPIDSIIEEKSVDAVAAVTNRFNTMRMLYPEAFDGVEVRYVPVEIQKGTTDEITGEVSGASYKAVTYVKVTSDQATRMSNLLDALDNA